MPYASKAQRRKFHALHKEGLISSEVLAEYNKASKGKKLPARVKKKKVVKKKSKKK